MVVLVLIFGTSIAMDAPENDQAKQLCEAIRDGKQDYFDALLKAGVNRLVPYQYFADNDSKRVRTPIMFAIMYHRFEMGKELLSKDANKQIDGDNSGTLMHYAALYGSYEFIPLLMSSGGKIDDTVISLASSQPAYKSPERITKTLLVLKRYTQKKGKGD